MRERKLRLDNPTMNRLVSLEAIHARTPWVSIDALRASLRRLVDQGYLREPIHNKFAPTVKGAAHLVMLTGQN